MARHLDSVCQLCRREGMKLYLKGSRCESPKCAIERRNQPPGMHGARQMVSHGHVLLNGKACNIPSLLLKAGDTVTVKSRPRSLQLAKLTLQESPPPVPDYLERTGMEPPEGRMSRLPGRADVDPHIQ